MKNQFQAISKGMKIFGGIVMAMLVAFNAPVFAQAARGEAQQLTERQSFEAGLFSYYDPESNSFFDVAVFAEERGNELPQVVKGKIFMAGSLVHEVSITEAPSLSHQYRHFQTCAGMTKISTVYANVRFPDEVYLTQSADGGITWSSPQRIFQGRDSIDGIQLACKENSIGIIVKFGAFQDSLFFTGSFDEGATFSPSVQVTESFYSMRDIRLAWGAERNLFLAYQADPGVFRFDFHFKHSADGGVTWPTNSYRVAADVSASEMTANEGKVYVAWQQQSDGRILIKESVDGKNFSPAFTIAERGTSFSNYRASSLQVDNQDRLYVVWTEATNGDHHQVMFRAKDGDVWRDPQAISSSEIGNSTAAISINQEGTIFAAFYRDIFSPTIRILEIAVSKDAGETWEEISPDRRFDNMPPIAVSAIFLTSMSVAGDGLPNLGHAAAVWIENVREGADPQRISTHYNYVDISSNCEGSYCATPSQAQPL